MNDPITFNHPTGLDCKPPKVAPSGILVNGLFFLYRGSPTNKTTPAATSTIAYDIGGNVTSASESGHSVSVGTDSSTNYSAPTSITTTAITKYTWSTFLGLDSQTGGNGDVGSVTYGGNARLFASGRYNM